MKLSHRDRVMLTIVLVIIVWAIGIWFFIIPAFQELGEKKDELSDRQIVLSKLNDENEKDKDLPQRIESAYNTSEELAKNFYTKQTTQNATNTVDLLLDDKSIVNSNMIINEYSPKTLKPFYYIDEQKVTDFDTKVDQYELIGASSSKAEASSKKEANPNIPDQLTFDDGQVFVIDPNMGVVLGGYDIEFNFKATYKDAQAFCQKLKENTPSSMVISKFTIVDVNSVEDAEKREAEKNKQDGGAATETKQPEKKVEKDEDGKEKSEFDYDDKVVEGTIGINLMLISKLSKPSF